MCRTSDPAGQTVVAGAADQQVIAGIADERVVADAAIEHICRGIAGEHVVRSLPVPLIAAAPLSVRFSTKAAMPASA